MTVQTARTTGLAFTIRLADGSLFTPSYEIHDHAGRVECVHQTALLCMAQGARILSVEPITLAGAA